MEHIKGKSLRDAVKDRGHLPYNQSIEILRQIAFALDYAHEHNVVHGDIKPLNIMVQGNGRIKLVDFGISRSIE